MQKSRSFFHYSFRRKRHQNLFLTLRMLTLSRFYCYLNTNMHVLIRLKTKVVFLFVLPTLYINRMQTDNLY